MSILGLTKGYLLTGFRDNYVQFKPYLISQKPTPSVAGLAAVREHRVHVWRGQTAAETAEAAGGEVPGGAVPGVEAGPVPAEPIQEVAASRFSLSSTIDTYRVVQLNFTPEIEVFCLLFKGSLSIFSVTSLKQRA